MTQAGRQRIDKWLWHARVVRTRSAAAALVTGGQVRLNGERVRAASRAVKGGDVLTVALDRTIRVLEVADFAERRGSAADAEPLFRDLTPPPDPHVPPPERSGPRPTKRDRRQLDYLRGEDEGREDED